MGFFDSVYVVKFWFEFFWLLCLVAGIVDLLMFVHFLVVGLGWGCLTGLVVCCFAVGLCWLSCFIVLVSGLGFGRLDD